MSFTNPATIVALTTVFLLALSFGTVTAITITTSRRSGLRSASNDGDVVDSPPVLPVPLLHCQITLVDVQFESKSATSTNTRDEYYECSPVQDNHVSDQSYRIDLPDDLFDNNDQRLLHGELFVSVSNSRMETDNVVLASDSIVSVISTPASFQGHRHLIDKTGTLSVLVLRISTLDASPSLSADDYNQHIFQDPVSLKGQYDACSFGKLNLVPTEHNVMDLFVNVTAQGATAQSLVNHANQALRERLDIQKVTQAADLTMMIMPPGTGDWAAFSGVNHYRSVFNDLWGSYQGALMHEVGHSLGLNHAYENGQEYSDFTGYMSAGHKLVGAPAKCFNGYNHWHLGWYDDRSVSVDPEIPQLLKIAAFADYDKTVKGEYVVAEVGELYLQYNRAKGFNRETEEKADMLTIVAKTDQGTDLIAALDVEGDAQSFLNFQEMGRDLTIQICAVGTSNKNMDYMLVSVGTGPSLCDQEYSPKNPPALDFGRNEDAETNENDDDFNVNTIANAAPESRTILVIALVLAIVAVLSAILVVTVLGAVRARKRVTTATTSSSSSSTLFNTKSPVRAAKQGDATVEACSDA